MPATGDAQRIAMRLTKAMRLAAAVFVIVAIVLAILGAGPLAIAFAALALLELGFSVLVNRSLLRPSRACTGLNDVQ